MSDEIKPNEEQKAIELSDEELDDVSGGLNLSKLLGGFNQISLSNSAAFRQSKFVLDQVKIVNSEGSFESLHIELTNTESTAVQETDIS